MTDYETARERMRQAADAVIQAEADREAALDALQAVCPHKVILESPWDSGAFGDSYYPPERMCENCGYYEKGNSFKVLAGRAYTVEGSHILNRAHGQLMTNIPYVDKDNNMHGRVSRLGGRR
jgi:hypothetical protein